ncbi:MAG TPA: type II toxin-antitoxin system RelE/ParE family toxin [Thermoanaerobaculia bacterium]|jgi:plasmid stabilization system protein ParE
MARLTWTTEAASSIRDIYQSIARNRPETAQRTVESILNKVDSLTECPDLGQLYRYDSGGAVRVLSYGNFRVAYLVEARNDGTGDDDGCGEVVVLGVFHGLIFLPL